MKAAILTTIDPVLRVRDICALLKISRSRFYELKGAGRFGRDLPALVEVLPLIDSAPRYAGSLFVDWLDPKRQARLLNQSLLDG